MAAIVFNLKSLLKRKPIKNCYFAEKEETKKKIIRPEADWTMTGVMAFANSSIKMFSVGRCVAHNVPFDTQIPFSNGSFAGRPCCGRKKSIS